MANTLISPDEFAAAVAASLNAQAAKLPESERREFYEGAAALMQTGIGGFHLPEDAGRG